MQSINLKSSSTEISITLIMHHLEQVFFRSYLLKMLTLENFKNLNAFPRKYLIIMPNQRQVRCNQSSFMNKQLRKEIMTRTRLLNKYRNDNCAGNLFDFKRQRNLCVKLLRKSKKVFDSNLNVKRSR